MSFSILILVCAMNVAPADCQRDTASDVVRGPNVANEIMCAMHGQAQLAALAVVPRLGEEYVKIVCRRLPVRDAAARMPPPAGG